MALEWSFYGVCVSYIKKADTIRITHALSDTSAVQHETGRGQE